MAQVKAMFTHEFTVLLGRWPFDNMSSHTDSETSSASHDVELTNASHDFDLNRNPVMRKLNKHFLLSPGEMAMSIGQLVQAEAALPVKFRWVPATKTTQVGIDADANELIVTSRQFPGCASWAFTRRHGPWPNSITGVYICNMSTAIFRGVTMVVRPIRTGGSLIKGGHSRHNLEGMGAQDVHIESDSALAGACDHVTKPMYGCFHHVGDSADMVVARRCHHHVGQPADTMASQQRTSYSPDMLSAACWVRCTESNDTKKR